MIDTGRAWSVEKEAWRQRLREEISGDIDEDSGIYDVQLGRLKSDGRTAGEALAFIALVNASEHFITREHVNALRLLHTEAMAASPALAHHIGDGVLLRTQALLEVLESLLPPDEQ